MKDDLAEIRRRSGQRNPDLDINRVPEPFEVFVHHLRVPGHKEVEVHLPLECVGIGQNDQIIFSPEGQQVLDEAEALVRRS